MKTLHNTYIRDGIHPDHLNTVNMMGLHQFLCRKKIHQRATLVKLIHGWIPTQEFLYTQNRTSTPICPWCSLVNETALHIHQCSYPTAIMYRRDKLERYLKALAQCNTPVHILITLEHKLLLTQELPYSQHYQCATSLTSVHKNILIASIRHQNVLGWDSFLKGFISSYWGPIYTTLTVLSTNTGTR